MKNCRTKTPEQLQSEIKDFDDKISDLEKSRNKSAKTNKPVKKDKPTTSKGKSVANVPLKFLKSVQIGEVTLPPMGYFDIKKSDYHSGTPCTEKGYEHLGLYAKGIARFGNGDDALYFHYDANNGHYNGMVSRFGSQDFKNTVEDFPGIPTIVWKIKTNVGKTFYLLEHGDAAGFGSQITLIGKNEKGKFVKYFNTYKIKDTYLGEKNHRGIGDEWNKISFQDNTIIIRYGKYGSYNKFNAIGEFRFKWDEAAQWFGVEQIVYNQTPTEQKPAQENKPVANTAPMKFSQPVYIGQAGSKAFVGQDPRFKGGYFIEGASYNNGNLIVHGKDREYKTYDKGLARWGDGKDALYCEYKAARKEDGGGLKFGGKKNFVIFDESRRDIFKIETNKGITLYPLYYRYKWWTSLDIIGCREDGTWVKYIDMDSIIEQYFGKKPLNVNVILGNEEWKDFLNEISCKEDTIKVNYHVFSYNPYHKIESGEFRFKWDETAQWFSVEQIKY